MQVSRGYESQTNTNRNGSNKAGQNSNNDDDGEDNKFNGSTDSIELDTAMMAWRLADENHDGVVDRQEMANAAYQLLNDEDATEEEKAIGNMFATMVLGGKDGKGLDPYDGAVSENDMRLLANGDGEDGSISVDDFKYAMGNRFDAEGNDFTLDDLLQIAQPVGQYPPYAPPGTGYPPPGGQVPPPAGGPAPPPGTGYPPPGTGYPPPGTGQPPTGGGNNMNAMMVQIMQSIIQMLMQLLQVMGGGGQRTTG